VQRAIGAETDPPEPAPMFRPVRQTATEPPELPLAQAGRRFAMPNPKFLVFGAVGAVALISAAIAVPRLFGGAAPKNSPSKPAAAKVSAAEIPVLNASARSARPARTAKPAVPAPSVTVDPEERAKGVASGLATGRTLMASGDYGGAVVAFNETLNLDPGNAEAKAGIADAGERYKASKAERDALNNIKFAFRGEEFSSGLRLAYRLPPSVSASYVEGVKVAGWYNLAVVALRAGDCREALSHLDEALQVAPSDAEAKKLREFASRYAEAVKDRAFLDRVEALAFRPLPAS
jgi:tetratricopeptide (TPR) repeat protein